jgi:hypothetical protein
MKTEYFNHHHPITADQTIVDFGTGQFIADNQRIPLLKALNEAGLITRTHCYGHETGQSFISIILDNASIEVRQVNENDAERTTFNGKTELLIAWKRKD